jgi:GMP reductase
MVHIETDLKLDFKDVLIRPKRSSLSSRSQVSLERSFRFRHCPEVWLGVPLVAANMDTVGTFAMAEVLCSKGCLVAIHKHYSLDEWRSWCHTLFSSDERSKLLSNVFISTGISDSDLSKLEEVVQISGVRKICVDVANGYSEAFVAAIKKIRAKFPDFLIAAGNVVTSDMTEELILAGADIVKVGIGPGSVCTTRRMTGVGCPQLSAVLACADAAHGLGGRIISDGGCTCPGDVAKAFGGGADFVMLGGMLAGHDECAGELAQLDNGGWVKKFYGMSSAEAMNKYAGGVANYRASEGKCVMVPYRGAVADTLSDIMGGIRSCCTYVGASEIRELPKRTTFYRVSEQLNNVFASAPAKPDESVSGRQPTLPKTPSSVSPVVSSSSFA